jgi:endogenous inhibitor of DNA gyrase (YacG/DUF329 family)
MNECNGASDRASTSNARRDTPVKCAACGKATERKMRGQRYCSKRCRQWASRQKLASCASKQSPRYPYSRDATTPHKSASNFNGLQRRKSGSSIYFDAPLNILGGASFRWANTPQLDPQMLENIRRSELGGRNRSLGSSRPSRHELGNARTQLRSPPSGRTETSGGGIDVRNLFSTIPVPRLVSEQSENR